MKRILIAITLLCAFLCISCQKTPDAHEAFDTTADKVLDKYVEALGGRPAIEKVNSRMFKAVLVWGDKTGSAEHFLKAPNKYMSVTSVSEIGSTQVVTLKEGFDGNAGWGLDLKNNLRDWNDNEIATTKRNKDLHREIRLKDLYPTISLKEKEKIEDRDVYELEMTPASGKPEYMFFDAETGLLVRHEFSLDGPDGQPRPYVFDYEDYRDVDGVKVPFTVKRTKPSIYTLKIKEIKQNVAIDDGQFSKPGPPSVASR